MLCFASSTGYHADGRNIYTLTNWLESWYADQEHVPTTRPIEVLCYFYNLNYDAQFIFNRYNKINEQVLRTNGKVIQFSINIWSEPNNCFIKVTFRDALMFFPATPLSQLPGMFGEANLEKEIFPYNYYNAERYLVGVGSISEAFLDCKRGNPALSDFIASIEKACARLGDDQFDMYKYCLYYCNRDVEILMRCMEKFRTQVLEGFELDINNYLSISSLSIAYQKKQGCFDSVAAISGLTRKFLNQCVVGGRCMQADNKKQHIIG